MKIIETTYLTKPQKEAIFQLWNREYPEKLCYTHITDFERYLSGLENSKYCLLIDERAIIGWIVSFFRENERWFAIILDSRIHKQGFGTLLLNKLKEKENVLNGWVTDHNNYLKADGTPYFSPLAFYQENGFKILHGIRLETETLSAVKISWKRNANNNITQKTQSLDTQHE